jgi:ketosteroid isomerase-like protein
MTTRHLDLAALWEADDERVAAVLARDRVRLDAILCDDLVYTHSSGSEESKLEYIERVVSGRYDYRAFEQLRRSLRLAGEFAFMNGENKVDIVRDGAMHHLSGRYQMVWRWQDARWRLHSFCAAPIPRLP